MKAERKELKEIKKQEQQRSIGQVTCQLIWTAVHLDSHKENNWVLIQIPLDSQEMIQRMMPYVTVSLPKAQLHIHECFLLFCHFKFWSCLCLLFSNLSSFELIVQMVYCLFVWILVCVLSKLINQHLHNCLHICSGS